MVDWGCIHFMLWGCLSLWGGSSSPSRVGGGGEGRPWRKGVAAWVGGRHLTSTIGQLGQSIPRDGERGGGRGRARVRWPGDWVVGSLLAVILVIILVMFRRLVRSVQGDKDFADSISSSLFVFWPPC